MMSQKGSVHEPEAELLSAEDAIQDVARLRMSKALDAIHDEAVRLLRFKVPQEVEEGLHLIVSMSRYKFDVRSEQEKVSGR